MFPWVNLNLVLLVYVFLCVCVYWLGLDFSVCKLKTDLKNLHFLLKGKISLVTNTTEGGEDDDFPCSGVRPYCLHNLNIGLKSLQILKVFIRVHIYCVEDCAKGGRDIKVKKYDV